jgi:predicted metal-binding membrane protein
MRIALATAGNRAPAPRPADGIRSAQLAIIALLLALAALAWVVSDLRMAGMDAGPGTDPGALGFYVSTWTVMMAAMMFPSIAPMVLMYRRMQLGRRAQGQPVPAGATALFVAGYLLVWGASGLIGYAALKGGRALDGGLFGWDRAGRWSAAGVLAAAALYEFTPLKRVCLSHCRGPLAFLLGGWRDGRRGALTMGVHHGAWCFGCCWALMAALFALGAMSMTWMLVIGALIAVEKLLPWRAVGTVAVAVVLAALAIGVAAAPADVPALTVPGSAAASHAMQRMHMAPPAMKMKSSPASDSMHSG